MADMDERLKVFQGIFADRVVKTPEEVHSVVATESCLILGLRSGKIMIRVIEEDLDELIEAHSSAVNIMIISDDNKYIISGGQDKKVIIWNLETFDQEASLPAHNAVVTSLCTKNGFLYTGSVDESVKIWDLETKEIANEIKFESSVCSIKATDDFLIVGCDDGSIRVHNIEGLDVSFVLCGHEDAVWTIDVWNNIMISGGFDGKILICDLKTQTQEVLGEHQGVVNKVMIIDPSGANIPMIISGGSDNLIKIWSLEGLKDTLEYHQNSISSIFNIDYYLITASFDKTVRMWNWMNTMKTKKVFTHNYPIVGLATDSEGNFYYTSEDSIVRQKASDPRDKKIFKDFEGKVTCIALDESSQILACGSRDRMVRLLSTPELNLATVFVDHESIVTGVSLYQGLLVSADSSGNMILCDYGSVLNRHSIEVPISSVQINQEYISCTTSNSIYLFSHNFASISSAELEKPALSHCFTEDSAYIFVSFDDSIQIHKIPELTKVAVFPVPYQVTSLSIIPSIPWIFCASNNHILMLPHYIKECENLIK